jgi:hypothetical protein
MWHKVSSDESPNKSEGRLSECGRFFIWVQRRPRQEPAYYGAARVVDGYTVTPWFGDCFDLKEAKEACEEAARHERP